MPKTSGSDELPSPKRGAFPTPKDDIDKAKPYIPEPVSTEENTEEE